MPISGSSRRSSATRCSAERPCSPKASRSPRTIRTRLSAVTRPSAAEPPPARRSPVWQGSSRAASRSITPSRKSPSTSDGLTSTSAMPVQPVETTSRAWYSSAVRPTAAAFTRSGMSWVTSTTGPRPAARRSAARLSAQARMRVSLPSVRKPAGSTSGSVWLSSTCSVPPASPIGTGASSRPCSMRRSSSVRNAVRANHPSSGWCRLPSSSEITTSGRTTSCSSNRVSDHGSDRRTEVSST